MPQLTWRLSEVLDAKVWLAETDTAYYRIIERAERKGHYVAEERKANETEFLKFMSANTLGAAKSAAQAYSEAT